MGWTSNALVPAETGIHCKVATTQPVKGSYASTYNGGERGGGQGLSLDITTDANGTVTFAQISSSKQSGVVVASVNSGGTNYEIGDRITVAGSDDTGKVINISMGTDTITAGSFIVHTEYTITATGNTNFTLIGAVNSNVGTVFTATGAGTGTGTASGYSAGIGYKIGDTVDIDQEAGGTNEASGEVTAITIVSACSFVIGQVYTILSVNNGQ